MGMGMPANAKDGGQHTTQLILVSTSYTFLFLTNRRCVDEMRARKRPSRFFRNDGWEYIYPFASNRCSDSTPNRRVDAQDRPPLKEPSNCLSWPFFPRKKRSSKENRRILLVLASPALLQPIAGSWGAWDHACRGGTTPPGILPCRGGTSTYKSVQTTESGRRCARK